MGDVDVNINYRGVRKSAAELAELEAKVGHLLTAEERAALATDHFEKAIDRASKSTRGYGREASAASAAQKAMTETTRGAAVRVEVAKNRTDAWASALGSLGSAMQGLSPEFDAFGQSLSAVGQGLQVAQQMPGQVGLALGAMTTAFGLARAAVVYFDEQSQRAAEAQRELVVDLEAVTAALDDQVSAYRRVDAQRRISAGFGTASEYNTELERQSAIVRGLEEEEAALAEVVSQEEARRRAAIEGASGTIAAARALELYNEQLAAQQTRLRQVREELESRKAALAIAEDQAGSTLMGELQSSAAANDNGDPSKKSRRRGRGRGRSQADLERERLADLSAMADGVLGDLDEIAARIEVIDEEQAASAAEKLEIDNARIDAARELADWQVQLASDEKDRLNEQWELVKKIREHNAAAEEKATQKRLADAREITGAIEGTLQRVASAYMDAFGQAIEGQKTLEQAALDATKVLLKSIGEEMVALGIKETLEGFANIVANPPVAATKIPMGIALIAAGAGMGAAGAAIPSQPSAPPESPRGEDDRGGSGGGGMLVVNYNSPFVTSGTEAQLSRQMRRQIDDGRDFATRRSAA